MKSNANSRQKNRYQFVTLPKSNLYNYLIQRDKNQLNCYFKEIADLAEIKKNLTFHHKRHTFATLALSYGMSIESVSKMLGHNQIRTTQIYAKVTEQKIAKEMQLFKNRKVSL